MILSQEKIDRIEQQILNERKTVDFDTKEYPVEVLVSKYSKGIDNDENEIFVPEYQRDFVWDDVRQSKLIESITLGLPIPIIFLAENEDGRQEIVDGSQRVRTIVAFLEDELELCSLERLTELNGLKFSDIPKPRQNKIKNTSIRMIVLSESATEDIRNDLFERINRGSDLLRNMEKRKGIYQGEFNTFIYNECAKNQMIKSLAPLSKSVKNRQEHEELILRFFLLIDDYPSFNTHSRGIGVVLDEYFKKLNENFTGEHKQDKRFKYERMLNYVNDTFKNGFAKKPDQGVSRIFFEALSAGVHFALEENPNISRKKFDPGLWLNDHDFKNLISGKQRTHIPGKIKSRIDFVKEKLLQR